MSAAQQIWSGQDWLDELSQYISDRSIKKLLLVCGRSYDSLCIREDLEATPAEQVRFSGFAPNPLYEDVRRGVERFRAERCDGVLAVGGGSAIDTAKCIKLYCKMDPARNYLEQEPADTGVPLIAIPTTAGTGSESTRFAVIYRDGVKQSVTHESILPDAAFLVPSVLGQLPLYQRKCTMLDALCQGIESWWSVNSTDESKQYAQQAIQLIADNMDTYLAESGDAAEQIMLAANYSGRAINITQTTAPHAMSYKLTSLYGLPHGHAVAVCLPEVWEYMLAHTDGTADKRGQMYLQGVFNDIAGALGCADAVEAVRWFRGLLTELGMIHPQGSDKLDDLAAAVNPVRLKNNPVPLSGGVLRDIYERILNR